MTAIVIDTNVLLLADGQGNHMSLACRTQCENRLRQIQTSEQVVLDDAWFILGEYHNKLAPNKQPTPGSLFVKWLLQIQGMPQHVARVKITPIDREGTKFVEFPPDLALETMFDPSDRKFVAAANAHAEKPPILEAADSKWLGWEAQLAHHGIRIEFLCHKELEAIRHRRIAKQ